MAEALPENGAMARSIDAAETLLRTLRANVANLEKMAAVLIGTLRQGHRVLSCGNGGSAAEALHFTEELVGRFHRSRRALSGICLCADPTALTCIANDWTFAEVFARQVEAHGQRGDVLVGLTTSGRSESVVRALQRARGLGLTTVGLLGPSGSPAEEFCDHALTLDGHSAARIQEGHLLAIHLFLEQIDAAFSGEPEAG